MRQMTEELQQQPLSEPASWMTVRQVQQRTGIRLNTIHVTLWRAQKQGAPWIKREGPGKRARLLVNTDSPQYRAIEEGWLTHERQTEEIVRVQPALLADPPADPRTEYLASLVAQWARFGVWLADHQLIVYRNAIDRDPEWSWSWGQVGMTPYDNKTEAMIAALKYQLCYGEPLAGPRWKRQMREISSALLVSLRWLSFWIRTRAVLSWNWFFLGGSR